MSIDCQDTAIMTYLRSKGVVYHANPGLREVVEGWLAYIPSTFPGSSSLNRSLETCRTISSQHQAVLGRFAFDDLVLQRTIADVCVAHGLRTHELEDQERFPDRRDIRSDAVNVRLIAILLRLGDLFAPPLEPATHDFHSSVFSNSSFSLSEATIPASCLSD